VIVCFVDIGGIDDHKLLPKTFHIKGYGYGVQRHFQQYSSYIVAVSFVDRGNLLYRSMWTIGRSQRVEEKKYRPIVRKIR
jgi:hypothetical protein